MQLAVQPTDVRAGDTVRLAVTVVNPRPDTVVLDFGQECQVSYLVLDDTDRVVDPTDADAHCIAPGEGRLVLAPGATWRADAEWRVARGGDPLPPGSYRITAILGGHFSIVRGKREYKMGSGAERVPIRVLPAARRDGAAAAR